MKQEFEVDVPRNVGRAGFLRTIEAILKLPRVLDIHVDAKGRVTCTRDVEEGESTAPLLVDFETISPYAIIRSATAKEVVVPEDKLPAEAVSALFSAATTDRVIPIGFAVGGSSILWPWFNGGHGQEGLDGQEEFFGQPVFRDRAIEDDVLFLCAGSQRGAALLETTRAYKIVMWRYTP